MTKAVDIVKTKHLAALAHGRAAKRKRKPGGLHKPGAHWYALEAYFDANLIEALPVKGSGFMLGVLEDMVVIEVPEHFSPEQISVVGDALNRLGLKVLVVRAGISFLRLRAVDELERARLDSILVEQRTQVAVEAANNEAGT